LRKYTLQPDEHYGIYTGQLGNASLQVLAGYRRKQFLIISFDQDGDLKDVSLKAETELVDKSEEAYLQTLFVSAGFILAPIHVHKFFLEEHEVGIRDLPQDMEDVFNDRESYSDEEWEDYVARLEQWKFRGDFVFWWGNDFWCDYEGYITAS
jgi:hypothetical protein